MNRAGFAVQSGTAWGSYSSRESTCPGIRSAGMPIGIVEMDATEPLATFGAAALSRSIARMVALRNPFAKALFWSFGRLFHGDLASKKTLGAGRPHNSSVAGGEHCNFGDSRAARVAENGQRFADARLALAGFSGLRQNGWCECRRRRGYRFRRPLRSVR